MVGDFHGQTQTAVTFEKDTRFSDSEINTLNAIAAYPRELGVSSHTMKMKETAQRN